jgi:hypothetical protein
MNLEGVNVCQKNAVLPGASISNGINEPDDKSNKLRGGSAPQCELCAVFRLAGKQLKFPI